jgi:uncharacterized protein YqeY
MLIEQIKTQQLAARKSGNSHAAALTTLLSEASMIGKNDGNRLTTDGEVVAVVKKFIKNLDETILAIESRGGLATPQIAERAFLSTFLPQQLTEADLREIAEVYSSLPAFMKRLKDSYPGQYDGKLASTVGKSVFTS